jgi:hypothetical protein
MTKFEISFFAKFCFSVSILLFVIVNVLPNDFGSTAPSYGLIATLLVSDSILGNLNSHQEATTYIPNEILLETKTTIAESNEVEIIQESEQGDDANVDTESSATVILAEERIEESQIETVVEEKVPTEDLSESSPEATDPPQTNTQPQSPTTQAPFRIVR